MEHAPYPLLVEPLNSEDGDGFLATVPDLPGCMSDGETPDKAVRNVQGAVAAWIEEARVIRRPLPFAAVSL